MDGSAKNAWKSRGYLPHFDNDLVYQFITYRLADSLPKDVIERYIQLRDSDEESAMHCKYMESVLDNGAGSCILGRSDIAALVVENWQHFHGVKYDLISWVVMPNHVHVLINPCHDHHLQSIVHSWKSFTAKKINNRLQSSGVVWARDYWDRYIRTEDHFHSTIKYIERNPVKCGFVKEAKDWVFGSAARNS